MKNTSTEYVLEEFNDKTTQEFLSYTLEATVSQGSQVDPIQF